MPINLKYAKLLLFLHKKKEQEKKQKQKEKVSEIIETIENPFFENKT